MHIFPNNSTRLEISGIFVSPKPCRLFRKIQIIAGNMNKTEFIDAWAKNAGLTKKDASLAFDAFVDTVRKGIKGCRF